VGEPARRSRRAVVTQALGTSWRASRRGTLAAAGLQLLGVLSTLGVVLAGRLALEALLTGGASFTGRLVWGLVLLALSTAVAGSVGVLQQQHQRVQGERVSELLWGELLDVCARVDLARWQSPEFMDRLDRVRSNALSRPIAVVGSLFTALGSSVGVLALAVALAVIDPLLIPVLLLSGLPVLLVARVASRSEFRFAAASNPVARRRLYVKVLLTDRSSAAEVRAFDSGPAFLARHRAAGSTYLGLLRRQALRRQGYGLLATGASALALTATFVLIVWFVQRGRLSLAEAGAAAIAARLLGAQLGSVFTAVSTLIEAGPFLDDMRGFLAEVAPVSLGTPRALDDELVVESVDFRYEGQAVPALSAVSLRVPRGAVVALVGENGSGKSTLAKVVSGLYAPDAGKVTWDGDPAISRADLRASTSVLFQDFVHYQLTATENVAVARGAEPVAPDEVRSAARRAGVDAALAGLPSGYDTVLGLELAEGADLSGGQWQRLALARALYRDRSLVVLDEPTAALDPRAEHELFADVRRVLDGRAALLISHRWSSVRLADYIYVLHEGRVVEQGTHEELVARAGRYAELYELQARAYLER
jgi:ATP-binding cassette, subfamily B, bacterial